MLLIPSLAIADPKYVSDRCVSDYEYIVAHQEECSGSPAPVVQDVDRFTGVIMELDGDPLVLPEWVTTQYWANQVAGACDNIGRAHYIASVHTIAQLRAQLEHERSR